MGMIKEFKEFALGGSLVDMAVGIVMGGAIGGLVKALIDDLISPIIGMCMGGKDFSSMGIKIGQSADGTPLLLQYGAFLNALIEFLILAFVIFMIVKMVNTAKKRLVTEEAAVAGPTEIDLLTEIRDSLKK